MDERDKFDDENSLLRQIVLDLESEIARKEALQLPKAGNRFGVKCYEVNTPDIFGRPFHPEWFFGKAVKVTHSLIKGCRVEIKFRDHIIGKFEYPSSDHSVQKVHFDKIGMFAEFTTFAPGEKPKGFAFDNAPETLCVGDLVDVKYQNGYKHGQWFCGRIAKVDAPKNTAVVALYSDRQVEYNVPMKEGKISLVACGHEDPAWWQGLTIHRTCGERKEGTIISFGTESGRDLTVKVDFNGKLKVFPFAEIVVGLFDHYLETMDKGKPENVRLWPVSGTGVGTGNE